MRKSQNQLTNLNLNKMAERTGKIVLTQAESGKTLEITITQAACPITFFSDRSFVNNTITATLHHAKNETVVLKRELYHPTEGDSAIIKVGAETVTLTNSNKISELSFNTGNNTTTPVSIELSDEDGNSANFAMGLLKILSATTSTVTTVQSDAQVSIELKAEADPTDGLVIETTSPKIQSITLPTNSLRLNANINSNDGYTSIWSKVSGGNATITTPNAEETDITGLAEGTYVFRITATGVHGATAFRDFTVIVKPEPEPVFTPDAIYRNTNLYNCQNNEVTSGEFEHTAIAEFNMQDLDSDFPTDGYVMIIEASVSAGNPKDVHVTPALNTPFLSNEKITVGKGGSGMCSIEGEAIELAYKYSKDGQSWKQNVHLIHLGTDASVV